MYVGKTHCKFKCKELVRRCNKIKVSHGRAPKPQGSERFISTHAVYITVRYLIRATADSKQYALSFTLLFCVAKEASDSGRRFSRSQETIR